MNEEEKYNTLIVLERRKESLQKDLEQIERKIAEIKGGMNKYGE